MNADEINDIREKKDFTGISFSGYKKSDVKKQLIHNINNNKIEESCYWSAELICSGHFLELWEIIIFISSKHIHLGNPKLPIYLNLRFSNFKTILQNGYNDNEIQLRNNKKIRLLFCEIICVLCLSTKKPSFENIKIEKDAFDMVSISSKIKVQDTFLFPRDKFTHITAFYFTIYYLKDKKQFFENSYSWLKPNGYLVIHLVDKLKFDPILNSADPLTLINPQDYSEKRLTKSAVVFDKFEYFSNFNLEEKGSAYFNEKFKFENGDVRINQHELFMEDRRHILDLAIQCGFTSYKYVDLSDINYNGQYIYILKKNTQ